MTKDKIHRQEVRQLEELIKEREYKYSGQEHNIERDMNLYFRTKLNHLDIPQVKDAVEMLKYEITDKYELCKKYNTKNINIAFEKEYNSYRLKQIKKSLDLRENMGDC